MRVYSESLIVVDSRKLLYTVLTVFRQIMLEIIFNLFQDIKWYNVKHKGSHEFGTITDFSVLEMQFYSMFLLSCLGMYSRGSIIMYCLITSFMVHVYIVVLFSGI